ncbi:phosphotransferase family protein [Sinimarinibacterium flocculans]|uniref:phosphotransferase family protein n=1 Tax=Sinimarinibacterium flocculans TaxID=985250 RepID=UPI0024901C13|nr:phosphotransferase family protein [Sinimarinibacterium flocculans]
MSAPVGAVDKDRPSPEWIAALRRRFPVEREIDHVLTRKLERRAGPPYAPLSLETLVEGTRALLSGNIAGSFEIRSPRWLSGGASKLQMAFELEREKPGRGRGVEPVVLRMDPAESIVCSSRLREYELIRAFDGIIPVPPVHCVDAEGEYLPYPAILYGFAEGVAKPSVAAPKVSGIGTNLGAALRERLAPQFIEHLGRVHTRDYRNAGLAAFDLPQTPTQSAAWAVDWWERVWEEDGDEEEPLLRYAAAWLRAHLPAADRLSIVHADFRVGNFLFDETTARITAWLDWELGRIGDRHQDLAWTTSPAFSHYAEDGRTWLVGGLLPENAFFEAYERASGLRVDRRSLHWYKVFNAWWFAIIVLAAGYRAARNGKTHQDVLVAWLIGLGPMLMSELRGLLENA